MLRTAEVLEQCGLPRPAVAASLHRAAQELMRAPSQPTRPRAGPAREVLLASQLLSEWYDDPDYVGDEGPRPLPLYGPRSISSLARRVNRGLSPDEALAYLLETGAVRRVGRRYIPQRRWVSLRGSGAQAFSTLRYLEETLRTLAHNLRPASEAVGRPQRIAEHWHIPESQLPRVYAQYEREMMRFLRWMDILLKRTAAARQPGERTTWLAVGVLLLQHDLDAPHDGPSRSRRPRQRPEPRRGATR